MADGARERCVVYIMHRHCIGNRVLYKTPETELYDGMYIHLEARPRESTTVHLKQSCICTCGGSVMCVYAHSMSTDPSQGAGWTASDSGE